MLPIVKSHNKHAEIVKSTCSVARSNIVSYLPFQNATAKIQRIRVLESNNGAVSKVKEEIFRPGQVKHLKLLDLFLLLLMSRIKIKDSM